ncbi:copper-transporting atpase paa1 [Striga asiatica]|uniref:Copper-transporting atpase paa1 n=1 Tax=Striga asiatica TaxID=4170 RepID=A0A5A7PB54_STRAF|nr:copper-transporting atpase paa1 [Striga asiatica]
MESTLLSVGASTTMSILSLSKSLNSHSTPIIVQLRRLSTARPSQLAYLSLTRGAQSSRLGPRPLARGLFSPDFPRSRLQFAARAAASYSAGGGGFGGIDGGGSGGGGDGAGEGGDARPSAVAPGSADASAQSSGVIILDVGGMTCGGCAASVKRILESQFILYEQPQVSSASVNLTTETAIVWPVSEARVVPNWRKDIGEALAKHLTSCGFTSNLRALQYCILEHLYVPSLKMREPQMGIFSCRMQWILVTTLHESSFFSDLRRVNFYETFEKKINEKRALLRESGRGLVVSWALCAVCIVGHLSHFFGAKAAWIHALHSTGFHMSLSLFTLLGPGRQLIMDGLKSLLRGSPNMNTLVGLGALSSFAVSSLAAFIPKLGWRTFFEEPVMLIAFVLLGKNLEQRAKIRATSDMTGLLSILPSKARLLINGNAEDSSSSVEVPSHSLSVGDQIIVLPGDRIPADGVVRAGRSSVDESSFTGEPLPVTKLPGADVAAGSINLNGKITIEVRRPGGETAIGDIVRLVEEAQTREAPVQRLADKVAGHFTYGVMALSAATFMFWNLYGSHILPAALYQGSSMSLALQLSCSVLVVACPCALGLATPTAVLVGTSLGAKRGLLLRGGSILEKFSAVNTIVFDKTGTLTMGKPTVTKVVIQGHQEDTNSELSTELRCLIIQTATDFLERLLDLASSGDNSSRILAAAQCRTSGRVGFSPRDVVLCEKKREKVETAIEAVPIAGERTCTKDIPDSKSTHKWSEVEVLKLAAGVESSTIHPIGKAIVEAAKTLKCPNVKAVEGTFTEEPGSGAVATIDEKKVAVGTLDWVQRHGVVGGSPFQEIEEFKNQSVVYVGVDGILAGVIYVEDQIREDAPQVIESLTRQGISTYLLSGDKRSAAEYVASAVGIPKERVLYGVKPDEKKKFISRLQEGQNIVAMVGDGINDAAALASSHVGVAIGGGLLDALELSRVTMKTVKQNLWWAFAYNIIGIPVAAGTLLPVTGTMLSPSIAGALMGLSSIGVMTNSLLLRLKFTMVQKNTVGKSLYSKVPSDIENPRNED